MQHLINMIKKTLVIGASLMMSVSAIAAEGWMTDFEAAKKKAKVENKALLVDFTGSDWCHWCIKLDEEVFQKPEFKGSDKFVLVALDYPRDKSKQSAELIAQNKALQEQFGVRGYPSIYLMDADARPFAKTGYQEGGPENYNKHLDELLTLQTKRDEAFAEAEKIEDKAEKAKKYIAALNSLEGVSTSAYTKELEMIVEAEPKNRFANEQLLLNKIKQASSGEEAVSILPQIDKFAKDYALEGNEKQEFLGLKINLLYFNGFIEELAPVLEEVIAVNPESDMAKQLASFKEGRYVQMLAEDKAKKKAKE